MSFIYWFLDGLPSVPEGDVEHSMVERLRSMFGRLNEELSFVRDLAKALSEIAVLEK